MKYLLFVFLLQFSFLLFAQENNFDILIQKHKNDTILNSSLLKYEKQGIGKKLIKDSVSVDSFIAKAESFIGTRHCMGGLTHRCIDCSGLLYVSFRKIGINVPHSSEKISRYGKVIISQDSLKRGDLVFFIRTYKTSKFITHSGIYLGNYKFIHASASKGVIISDLRAFYYQKHFIFGTRVF